MTKNCKVRIFSIFIPSPFDLCQPKLCIYAWSGILFVIFLKYRSIAIITRMCFKQPISQLSDSPAPSEVSIALRSEVLCCRNDLEVLYIVLIFLKYVYSDANKHAYVNVLLYMHVCRYILHIYITHAKGVEAVPSLVVSHPWSHPGERFVKPSFTQWLTRNGGSFVKNLLYVYLTNSRLVWLMFHSRAKKWNRISPQSSSILVDGGWSPLWLLKTKFWGDHGLTVEPFQGDSSRDLSAFHTAFHDPVDTARCPPLSKSIGWSFQPFQGI